MQKEVYWICFTVFSNKGNGEDRPSGYIYSSARCRSSEEVFEWRSRPKCKIVKRDGSSPSLIKMTEAGWEFVTLFE